jgi:hypothetical protein
MGCGASSAPSAWKRSPQEFRNTPNFQAQISSWYGLQEVVPALPTVPRQRASPAERAQEPGHGAELRHLEQHILQHVAAAADLEASEVPRVHVRGARGRANWARQPEGQRAIATVAPDCPTI